MQQPLLAAPKKLQLNAKIRSLPPGEIQTADQFQVRAFDRVDLQAGGETEAAVWPSIASHLGFRVEHPWQGDTLFKDELMSKSNRKVYRIKLTDEERESFGQVAKGKRGKLNIAKWKVQRATQMLKCDESEHGPGWADERIAETCGVTTRAVQNWRKQAFERGPLSLLERKNCLLYTSPRPRDKRQSRMPSSA